MRYTQKMYNTLVTKIRKELGISVHSSKADWLTSSSRCHFAFRQRIKIGTRGPKYIIIAALAHELGHCLVVRDGKSMGALLATHYNLNCPLSRTQKAQVMQEERNAWTYGFKFLRDNGIQVNQDMLRLKRMCLKMHTDKLASQ